MTFHPSQTIFAWAVVNVRRTPGFAGKPPDDVVGLLGHRAPATVTGQARIVDGLTWWPVRAALLDGSTGEGWCAQTLGDTVLLAADPPAIEPDPEPTRPTATGHDNKLGFYLHQSTDQSELWSSIARVQPPVILVHADTANNMLLQEIRSFRAPDAFVIGRMFKDLHTQRTILESANPEDEGHKLADEIIAYDFGLASKRGANGRLLIDAWMSLNECIPGPASDTFQAEPERVRWLMENYDRLQAAFRQRLQEAGLEAVAFNFAAGNFTEPAHYLDFFPRTLASHQYLGFHEYGWPALKPGPGVATSAGLYRHCMEGIRARFGDRHRAIITEAGLTRAYGHPQNPDRGWLDPADALDENAYWQTLAWYNEHLAQDEYVLGACLYEVGHHGDWITFRHLGQDNQGRALQLVDRIAGLRSTGITESNWRTDEAYTPAPTPVTVTGVVTLTGQPVADAEVRLAGGQATVGAVARSACAAPASVTWTKAVTGFAGTTWNAWSRYVAQDVAGITWSEFRRLVGIYNPTLAPAAARLNADQAYLFPENRYTDAEIVWDRPLAGFAGTLWACWQQHVAQKVIGLAYADFKRDVVLHNPALAGERHFEANRRYTLPRNVGVKEYVQTSYTDGRGRFNFADLPAGDYRLTVQADGALPFITGFSTATPLHIDIPLQPLLDGLEAATGFVDVAGTEFILGGQRLRFIGVNVRGLVHYGDGQTLPHAPDGHRSEQLQAAREMGARVVRVFLPSVHADAEQVVLRLQSVIELIETHFPELYILPAFTNLYADVPFRVQGDDAFYRDNVLVRDFFAGGYRQHYLPFVRRIVQAFHDEPRIFAWEIGNELKLDRGNPNDEHDPNPLLYIDFVHTVAQEIRSLDPNHLITTGMISTRHAWLFSEALKRRLYAVDNLHFLTIHAYQGENLEDDSPIAQALNKPFIIEEAGFDAGRGEDRSGRVDADMEKWFARGARGYLQWGFMATPDNGDGDRMSGMDRGAFHDDWDALTATYRQRAQALAQLDPNWKPPITGPVIDPSRPPQGFEPGQIVFAWTHINVRQAAGHLTPPVGEILGQLAPGEPAEVLGAAQQKDGLTWWPIRATLLDGQTVKGWAAEVTGDDVLLGASRPPATNLESFGEPKG